MAYVSIMDWKKAISTWAALASLLFSHHISVASEGTAASVLIDFARTHHGENFDQVMTNARIKGNASVWSAKITLRVRDWTAKEAHQFLDFLVENIGIHKTLRILRNSTGYLKTVKYPRFRQTVDIMSAWAGRDAVIQKIGKSLSGFQYEFKESTATYFLEFFREDKTPVEEMMELLQSFLQDYDPQTRQSLIFPFSDVFDRKGRLGDFDRTKFIADLKGRFASAGISTADSSIFVDFVDDYLCAWELTTNMMLKNTADFVRIDTDKFDKGVTFLKRRGHSMAKIKEAFKNGNAAAALYIHDGLESIALHMEDFFGGGEEAQKIVDKMMMKNLAAFSRINTGEFDKGVDFLKERGHSMAHIREAFEENAGSAMVVRDETLSFIAQHLEAFLGGGEEAKQIVDQMMINDLSDFSKINIGEFDKAVTFFKRRGHSMADIRQVVRNTRTAFLFRDTNLALLADLMQAFLAGEEVDFDSLLEQIHERDCYILSKVLFNLQK